MVGMAGKAKKILAGAGKRVGETTGRLRQRAAVWRRKRFLRNAYQFWVSMREELEEAKRYLADAVDAEGKVMHQSKIPAHIAVNLELCIKDLAVSLNAAESIATMQRFPGLKESSLQRDLQADIMRTKKKELEREHGTVAEGMGRKYYIEFLVKERLVRILASAESQRQALLRFLGKEGHA